MQLTGANKILLFYTTLQEKQKKFEPNKDLASCCGKGELPREICNELIKILIAKEKMNRQKIEEESQVNETIELKKDIKRIEDKLNKILTALKL